MATRERRVGRYAIPEPTGGHPRFRVLSDDKLERIHEATVTILETVGVRVSRPEAVEMMTDAGCSADGDIVRIPRRLLEDAIDSAPKEITIFDREGEEALHLGGPEVYACTDYTPLEFFDLDTGARRPYTLDHYRVVSRVADALPNIHILAQPGVVRPSAENPLEVINHLEFEAMLTNCSKPIHALVANAQILNDCLEMAQAVAVANGAKSLRDKPFVLPMLNPISPLFYNDDTVDKLLLSVDWGIPVICGPMPLAGGTSPVTLAGTIALANAESLAGLVIAQTRRKGSPYVMITFAAQLDMRTGDVAGGPEGQLLIAGGLELGHYYRLPIAAGWMGGGGHGSLDAEGGWEQMMAALALWQIGGNAGVEAGGGTSLKALVAADEIIGMVEAMMKGVRVDDETLAIDVVRDVGPGGGTYLGHPHTYRHFRERWEPTLAPRMRYEDWVAAGSVSFERRVEERMREIIRTHKPKPIPAAARATIAAIIERARARARTGTAVAD